MARTLYVWLVIWFNFKAQPLNTHSIYQRYYGTCYENMDLKKAVTILKILKQVGVITGIGAFCLYMMNHRNNAKYIPDCKQRKALVISSLEG